MIRLDFPLSGDERADRAIRPIVSRAVELLVEEVGGHSLESVILTGSLSRGEASVLVTGASCRLLGDVELLVIFRSPFDWPLARRAMAELGRRASGSLAPEGASASVEYAPAGMVYLTRRIRPSIFAYDLLHHGKVVWGRPDVLGAIRPFEPCDIPRDDALLLVMNRIVERLLLDEKSAQGLLAPGERAYHLTKLMLDLAGSALAFSGRHVSSYAARRECFASLLAANDALRAALPERVRFEEELERATRAKLHPTEEQLVEDDIVPRLHRALVWTRALWLWEARQLLSRPAADFSDLAEVFLRRERARERLKGWVKCYRHPLRPRRALAPLRTARLLLRASPQTLAYTAALLAHESKLRGCSRAAERARSLLPLRLERAGGVEAPLGELWQWLVRNN